MRGFISLTNHICFLSYYDWTVPFDYILALIRRQTEKWAQKHIVCIMDVINIENSMFVPLVDNFSRSADNFSRSVDICSHRICTRSEIRWHTNESSAQYWCLRLLLTGLLSQKLSDNRFFLLYQSPPPSVSKYWKVDTRNKLGQNYVYFTRF